MPKERDPDTTSINQTDVYERVRKRGLDILARIQKGEEQNENLKLELGDLCVDELDCQDESIRKLAKDLGIKHQTLHTWVNAARARRSLADEAVQVPGHWGVTLLHHLNKVKSQDLSRVAKKAKEHDWSAGQVQRRVKTLLERDEFDLERPLEVDHPTPTEPTEAQVATVRRMLKRVADVDRDGWLRALVAALSATQPAPRLVHIRGGAR